MIKLRPVAGHLETGYKFLKKVKTIFSHEININDIKNSIKRNRELTIKHNISKKTLDFIDIKNGKGGIRDIKFIIQGLQLIFQQKY